MYRMTVVLFALLLMAGCSNDDDGLGGELVPPRLLAEVEPENDEEILEYLQSHFYNYEEFDNPPAGFDFKIRIDTIAGENSDKTPLSQQVSSAVINVSSFEFGLGDGEIDIPHTYYYLEAREGIGSNISVADSAFVQYQGRLLDGTTFDGAENTGIWFDLARIQAPLQGARGFSEAIPNFKTGGNAVINPDGTFSVDGFGVGIMFLPSGLGFFNAGQAVIPAYSPLVFEIGLLTMVAADHDQDGIPSIQEDLNGNGYLYDDNTDQEDEENAGFPLAVNFLDIDDDDDGTLTRDEIIVDEVTGEITFPDTDGDGIPDYLDKDNS
ncbi:FKBP-type peptidyl-prolyl cis-trans isomerase [Flagellimonas sp. DF-77]|uniref:FKBP-type peptidyl-prolyl cis-trans isomerase n=1 Tax=Flagellimonas algarum TaxID=3230298 RepID=UPI00339413AE